MIAIFAPDGIGEVEAGTDLAELVVRAVEGTPDGPLRDGDVVVVTSKIVSKAEGRTAPAAEREATITAESTGTVARRGDTRIVRTRSGLTLAGAGVDNSNVAPGTVLLLPADADASAARLRAGLEQRTGCTLAVVVSDTTGRAWRLGQTDQAIGSAGLAVLHRYRGRTDPYGNDLQVTEMAVADEVAAAADLVKGKLAGRPVAVLRGLDAGLLGSADEARQLVREPSSDMFGYGAQEAVLAAALAATGQAERYEEMVALPPDRRPAAVVAGSGLSGPAVALLAEMLRVDLPALHVLRSAD